MPRAISGVVGFLLAIAVVVPAPSAPAQILSRLRRQQTPAQKGRYEMDAILSDEHQRLAEMKVELALLGDIATFPYDFAARAKGKTLELHGTVPNEMVRQRAMDLTRSITFLRGIDALTIQPNLSVRSSLRTPSVLQQEGMELLHKEMGAPALKMALEARPNGVLVLTGRIDCVESKLEISRLFRHLPGCTALVNELTVEPILLDGQRMVRVTHNNMLLVPPSALGQEMQPTSAPGPSAVKEKPLPVQPELTISMQPRQLPSPAPQRSSSLDALDGELRLPAAVASKKPTNSSTPVEKVGSGWEAFAPSKLPVKWGRPSANWETQAKELETAYSQRTPDAMPTPIRMANRPDEPKKTPVAAASKPSRANASSHLNFAETREKPDAAMTWRRPGGSEEAEPKITPTPSQPRPNIRTEEKTPPPSGVLRSSRRWPPAYATAPPPSQGQAGVIAFDDEAPPPKPAPTVIARSRSLVPAELQRQIKSLCGRQAREVVATRQQDGTVLLRVKVANRSIEEQLSRKILSVPEMTSPNVRLMMEIEP